MKFVMSLSLLALATQLASAKEITDIADIGPHQQVFVVNKNVNPENFAVVYTKVDEKCRFLTDPADRDNPVFDFYWRMNGTTYKPMAGFFKSQFHSRMPFANEGGDRSQRFVLEARDLSEMDHDLGENPKMDVIASMAGGKCDVQAFLTLGPSEGNARIRLDSIYGEGRTFPPAVFSVTLKGEVVDANGRPTGKKVAHKYNAK